MTVTAFHNGWCMGENLVFEWARRLSEERAGDVVFRVIDTKSPQVMAEWGEVDAVYVDEERLPGPPMGRDDVAEVIERHVAELASRRGA